jgi:hypothetical protein
MSGSAGRVDSAGPRQVTARGPGFRPALLQPGKLLGRSGVGGIGDAGGRAVVRPSCAETSRMVPVRRRDARVGGPIPACTGSPAVRAGSGIGGQARIGALQAGAVRGRGRDARVASSSAGLPRTGVATPERGLDPLRIVDVGGRHADARAGTGYRGGARPGGPDRKIRVVHHVGVEPPPPFFPVQHVPLAGADVSAEDRQAGKGGAVLGFLQDIARVMCPGR